MANIRITDDLIVVDEEYKNSKSYMKCASEFENIIGEYIKILDNLSSGLSGEFAANIEDFKNVVNATIKGVNESIYDNITNNMGAYIRDIDKADSTLY